MAPMRRSQKLDALRQRYAAKLPDKLAAIEDAANRAFEAPTDEEQVEALRRLAHQLAGSAGSYGFSDLGATAKSIDERIRVARGSGGSLDERARDDLRGLVARLRPLAQG